MNNISDTIDRKFIDLIDIEEFEITIETDTGWHPISKVGKTVQYDKWYVKTESFEFYSADTHIVFDEQFNEIFVEYLKPGDLIQTENGPEKILEVYYTNEQEHMFDVQIESDDHRYYASGVLHHNTTIAAAYLLWYAMFNMDKTILIAAHQFSGASEIMLRIYHAYQAMPDFIRCGAIVENKQSLSFDNGSRIIATATTEKTGRGLAISLIYLDEFAFVDRRISEALWSSIAPTLSTGGSCIITSTPNNSDDLFATIWRAANDNGGDVPGTNDFMPYTVSWDEIPGRDEEFKAKMISQLGESTFLREYNCEFISESDTLIDKLVLEHMKGKDPILKTGTISWFKEPEINKSYLVALDPSIGLGGGDNAAISVWQLPEFEQIAEWTDDKSLDRQQVRILQQVMDELHDILVENGQNSEPEIYYTVETNNNGESIIRIIEDTGEENFKGTFVSEPKRRYRGFKTTGKSKRNGCSKMKRLIESGKIKIHSKKMIHEMKNFIAKGNSFEAELGAKDDRVMSLFLAIRMLDEVKYYDDEVYDRLSDSIDNYDDELDDEDHPMPFII